MNSLGHHVWVGVPRNEVDRICNEMTCMHIND
jgi:hypothetical protein